MLFELGLESVCSPEAGIQETLSRNWHFVQFGAPHSF